jgi:hypothetical protein
MGTLLASRDLGSRHQLAARIEGEYYPRRFGHNSKLIEFARELISESHYEAAEELSRASHLLGGDRDPDSIIARVRGKFFLFRTSEGEVCPEECVRILRYAVGQGHAISVNNRSVITLTKGTSQTHLYSNEEIVRFGDIIGIR